MADLWKIVAKRWPTTPDAPDWDRLKESVMLTALRARLWQHEDLRALLLVPGDTVLIEHTINDRVREELRS